MKHSIFTLCRSALIGSSTVVLCATACTEVTHAKKSNSPIWMLTNMGAPIFFDTTTFKISEMKSSTEGWIIKASLPDDIYGSIAVELDVKRSSKTQLKISTASGVLQNYSGNLFPYERAFVFESEKAAK